VLVTEDHVVLAGRITEGLRDAGLALDVVNDGSAALTQAGLTAYDVIVLDRDLPVVHGDQVRRTLAAVAGFASAGESRTCVICRAVRRIVSWSGQPVWVTR